MLAGIFAGTDPEDEAAPIAAAAAAARMFVLGSFPIALSASSATSFGRLVEPRTSGSMLKLLPENGLIASIGITSGLLAAASSGLLATASACWFMAVANCWAVVFACEAWCDDVAAMAAMPG